MFLPFSREALDTLFKEFFNYDSVRYKVLLDIDHNFNVSQWINSFHPFYREIIKYLCLLVENEIKYKSFDSLSTPKIFLAAMQNKWFQKYDFIEESLRTKYMLERRIELEQLPDWRGMLRTY